jgi:hypothetical protein
MIWEGNVEMGSCVQVFDGQTSRKEITGNTQARKGGYY